MSLSSSSNTINALGIFGRLEPSQEKHFLSIQDKYSVFPEHDDAIGIFNHLSLVINRDVPIGKLPAYIDLLRELKPFLPLGLVTSGVIVRDEKHIALSFDTVQTQKIRDVAAAYIPEGVVTTFYTKIIWFVPPEKQTEVITFVKEIKAMIFYDFVLCANRQEDASTIYSSNRYQ